MAVVHIRQMCGLVYENEVCMSCVFIETLCGIDGDCRVNIQVYENVLRGGFESTISSL